MKKAAKDVSIAAITRRNLEARAKAIKAGVVIVLPNGRPCGLGTYAAAWRAVLKMPREEMVKGFAFFPEPAWSVLTAMRGGLSERINAKIPGYGVGRKWANDWYFETYRAARMLNTPRLIIDWLPAWLKPRFAERLRVNCA